MITKQKTIRWLPRILSLGFVLFLSLFSLDVFGQYAGWAIVPALLMHLLPALILLVMIIIAWKHDLFGFFIFFIFAIGYIFMVGLDHPWSWYVSISSPSVLIAILYLFSWQQKNHPKRRQDFN